MSVQTASRRESASQEEEDDEEFIKESTKLAKSFTEFFISSQAISDDTGKSPLVGHENKPVATVSTEEAYVGPVPLTVTADISAPAVVVSHRSHPVGNSLKVLAQVIDDEVIEAKFTKAKTHVLDNQGRTIWDVVYKDFNAIMCGVFTSLDESVLERSSGWEMAALVYRGVAGLVRDLRQQSGQNHGSRAREETLQGYVGNFLEETGLMTWINGQGGLGEWGSMQNAGERYRFPRTGTPV